jgi:hypothetical protein
MRYPDAEPEIMALARVVIGGLKQLGAELAAPPVSVEELQARVDRADATINDVVDATTTLRERHAIKDDAIGDVVEGTKAILKYAEVIFRDQPEKLNQLGWGPRREGSTLEAPGEVRDIQIAAEGDTR